MTETLSEAERETLVDYVADAMTFGAGASAEAMLSLRQDGPPAWAREFIDARLPVEVERIVAARVAAAEQRITEAVEAVLVNQGVDYEAERLRPLVASVSLWVAALATDLRAALARPTLEATPCPGCGEPAIDGPRDSLGRDWCEGCPRDGEPA